MKRFVATLFIMATGLLPVFAADETDFFLSRTAHRLRHRPWYRSQTIR